MPKNKAFIKVYNITYPDYDLNIDNDYSYLITPPSLEDNNYYVFAVKNDKRVRILVSELDYIKEVFCHKLDNIVISEIFITINELNDIISKLDIY